MNITVPPSFVLQFVQGFIPKALFFVKARRSAGFRSLEIVRVHRSPSQTSMLVPHSPTNTKNLVIQAVPRYIVRLPNWAYAHFNLDPTKNVWGQDMRGIAASLASPSGVSLSDVLLSGDWTNAGTFLRHYFHGRSPNCVRDV